MSDFGLQLFNSSGNLQIDSTFKNLGLREKGTTRSGGSPAGNMGWYWATVTTSVGNAPMIAFRSSSKCYLRYSSISGSQITYWFHCLGTGVTVQYWIFDDPSLATLSGNYGLQVFNASGSKVFDSRTKYMRVIDSISAAGSSGDALDNGFTRSYSGTPAVVQGQLRTRITNTAAGSPPNMTIVTVMFAPAVSFSGGDVSWKTETVVTVNTTGQSGVPEGQARTAYDYLVLDVSGI
ncbi:hypothetical protein BSFA1_11050 [Burkholderia sp. SFA1]|nr:hypothetical protein BSFA1_11050 [Burkholderia sp. SFA1]